MKKLTSSPFRPFSKAGVFLGICNLDYNNGHSAIVPLYILIQYELGLGNGGSWCRTNGPLGTYFNIDRKIEKGKIISVQLIGYRKNKFTNAIKKEILDAHKKGNCKFLAVRGPNIEVDHKDGRKDTFLPPEKQKMEDFQPLHKAANDAKRQHCKECKKTGKRFDATRLGYAVPQWIGPIEYKGSCVGCLQYCPFEFNAQTSSEFKKER